MTNENRSSTSPADPKPKSAFWVLLVMGGLIALIFIGDYLKRG